MQLYREGEEPAGRIGGKETRTARLLAQAAGLHAAMGSPALPAAQFAAKPRPLVDETCVRVVPPPEEDANVEELAVAEAPPPVPPPLPPSLTQVQATLREPAAARGWAGQACAPAASLSSCFDQQSSRRRAGTSQPRTALVHAVEIHLHVLALLLAAPALLRTPLRLLAAVAAAVAAARRCRRLLSGGRQEQQAHQSYC